jgi:hypothetical protein
MPSQFGPEIQRKESNGQNSPWRTREVVRAVGSSEVARRLGVGRTHHPSIKNQHELLISSQPMSLDHIANSGFGNLEARPNLLVCAKFQVVRNMEGKPNCYIRATGGLSDQNFQQISCFGSSRLERNSY